MIVVSFAGGLDGYVKYGEGYWNPGYKKQEGGTSSIEACASVCTGLRGCAAFFWIKPVDGNVEACYTYTETPASSAWEPYAPYDAYLRKGTSQATAPGRV